MIAEQNPPMPDALRAIVTEPGWRKSDWLPRYVLDLEWALVLVTADRGTQRWVTDWMPRQSFGANAERLRELADLLERIEQAIGGAQ